MLSTEQNMYDKGWGPYNDHGVIKEYSCPNGHKARMLMRWVKESSGDSHKEYVIFCPACGKKSSVHWSSRLTEHAWNAAGKKD